jgi:hypothetical protein
MNGQWALDHIFDRRARPGALLQITYGSRHRYGRRDRGSFSSLWANIAPGLQHKYGFNTCVKGVGSLQTIHSRDNEKDYRRDTRRERSRSHSPEEKQRERSRSRSRDRDLRESERPRRKHAHLE